MTLSNHLILCHSLLLLPSIFPSIRVFFNESAHRIRQPKYWNFSFCINPSSEYWGLIPFRIDWFDLPAVERTLKSLLQHHNWKASILQYSPFFTVQLSHGYTTTGKTITLTIWTFVSKVMSPLFNMMSRFVIIFLPRRKCLLISWLQSPSTVILDTEKIKSHSFHYFLFYLPWGGETGYHDLRFCWVSRQLFHSSFTLIKRSLVPLHFLPLVSSAYLKLLIFAWKSWFQLVTHPAQHFAWCTLHRS